MAWWKRADSPEGLDVPQETQSPAELLEDIRALRTDIAGLIDQIQARAART